MKKTAIRKIVEWLQSNDAGFIYALAGVAGQGVHVYFSIYEFSSIESHLWRSVEAGIISFFFSGLLFFILRAQRVNRFRMDKDNYYEVKDQNRRYKAYTHGFAWFDTFVNLHFYGNILWYQPYYDGDPETMVQWYKLIMAVPFSFALPWILTMYAGEIHEEDQEPVEPIVAPEPIRKQPEPVQINSKTDNQDDPADKLFKESKEWIVKESPRKKKANTGLIGMDGSKIPSKTGKALFTKKEEK